MADINKALEVIRFDTEFNTDNLQFNEEMGFIQLNPDYLAIDGLRLLGFGAPLSRDGGFDAANTVTPIVNFDDLAAEDRTIDINGKGVGPRMYNTPQAAHGLAELPPSFGAYTFDIQTDPHHLRDMREVVGNKLTQVARHGGRIVRGLTESGRRKIVSGIHEEYGSADAVLLPQPPRADIRQRVERHSENPDGMPAEFIIVRNAAITLRRVGTVQRRG